MFVVFPNKTDRTSLQKVNAAKSARPGKTNLALELVGYDADLENAMKFVFGGTIVCEDAESAKYVTFTIGGIRSVTHAGDVYDPSGTLSGGAAPSGNGILVRAQDLLAVERKLKDARSKYDGLQREEQRLSNVRGGWRQLSRDLEIKEHQLKLLEEQLGGSNANRVCFIRIY